MNLLLWFVFFLAIQVIHFLGTWKLYEKAGRKKWEAAVPVYNAVVWMKIIDRPIWWTLLLFVPIVNLIMFPVLWVESAKAFGKTSTTDAVLAVVTLGCYNFYLNYLAQDVVYRPEKNKIKEENTVSSLLFAIVVATMVHTYFIQPYTIPTSSLEKSLLIGDFLFVSKFHYGARTPMTTIAAPMVHDSLPVIGKSYTKWPQLPYFRFPGITKIKHNDIVVFNWPVDTVRFFGDRKSVGIRKPIDKKSNYVKRCVGLPGDQLSIKDGIVFIDDKELILPERAKVQYSYKVATDGTQLDPNFIVKTLQVTDPAGYITNDSLYFSALTEEAVGQLKQLSNVKSVTRMISHTADASIFPHTENWNVDNMGPIYIPEAGKTVELNSKTLPFYQAIIKEYEGNTLEVVGNTIKINGEVTNQYTFKQDYYWMMGDNRHNSEDSRYWGFVGENHIVGKPVFIWMSLDQNVPMNKLFDKIRWERLFTVVEGTGKPTSYFGYFVVVLAAYLGFDFYRKRKKKQAEKRRL